MKVKYLLVLGGSALLVWFILDALSQPSPQDLPGEFQEVAMFRNENNTGPVVRIYAVTVADTSRWQEMQQYGALMPHTKYGTTKVFFFAKSRPFPTRLQLSKPHFAPALNGYCLASYEKDVMSKVTFQKHPLH
ncbi:hypothetical protein SAMN06265337_1287 [Hymenobacter gelipurpurascens]|uniref:Uncharacterized protein n=1 Tax=Hymenobacter gelipurpurascens TaxID=89968 RepID=A0A212THG5_9BACT|nr:hypothetical protein [Hymenobacter gelipurpurascens]SNC65415.1 hypothetical protein SAMN06265337_1287 [Hymenobacter gelipurpurascens]